MIKDDKRMADYAKVIVKVGVNVQKGQPVVVGAIIEAAPLVHHIVEECYKAGASKVLVRYDDAEVTKLTYLNETIESLQDIPQYQIDYASAPVLKEGACRISIRGSSPDLLKSIELKKIQAYQKAVSTALKPLSNWTMSAKCQWTIACWPSEGWAKMVFPNIPAEEAIVKLWDAILATVRVDGVSDPISAWNKHNDETEKRAEKLNSLVLDKIHCKNSLGTDIEIKLVNKHIWLSGRDKETHNKWGAQFTANLPTEEVWTMPDKNGLNGIVYSSKPLSVNGNIIDDFWLKFEDGKVVDFDAKVGKQALESVLNTDEGSKRTGEIAIVPVSSPINQSKIMFFSTLYDENASCHIALGASYPNNIEHGTELNREELSKLGSNDSLVHVDFMFGTDDLDITGYTKSGEEVAISNKGKLLV